MTDERTHQPTLAYDGYTPIAQGGRHPTASPAPPSNPPNKGSGGKK
jgi:hypothetical protein